MRTSLGTWVLLQRKQALRHCFQGTRRLIIVFLVQPITGSHSESQSPFSDTTHFNSIMSRKPRSPNWSLPFRNSYSNFVCNYLFTTESSDITVLFLIAYNQNSWVNVSRNQQISWRCKCSEAVSIIHSRQCVTSQNKWIWPHFSELQNSHISQLLCTLFLVAGLQKIVSCTTENSFKKKSESACLVSYSRTFLVCTGYVAVYQRIRDLVILAMLGLFVTGEVCHEYDHYSNTSPQPPSTALQKTDLQNQYWPNKQEQCYNTLSI
jgi:hypothetical protein